MSKTYYTSEHEWLRLDEDSATIGITDHAQELLGDVVFVEVPAVGTELEAGVVCGSIESVKAASDIYAPVSGEVLAINTELESAPELCNQSPEQGGWLFKVKLPNLEELDNLMDADQYQELIAGD